MIPVFLILRTKYYEFYNGYFNKTKHYSEILKLIEDNIDWEFLFKQKFLLQAR